MKTLITVVTVCLLLTGFTSCEKRPNLPEKVYITVEKPVPPPSWATEQLPKYEPKDSTIAERLRSNEQRGGVIDYANCRSILLERWAKGEAVKKSDCEQL